MSYPSTGTDGSQYKLVEDLGHTKTKLYPGIGPLVADIPFSKELKGLRLNATVYAGDKSCNGDLLFTENGISGNSIFELSSYILREKIDKIYIDFLPLVDLDDLKIILKLRQDKLNDVVLTPSYVAKLLVKLARVDKDSYVWEQRCLGLIQYWERCA